MKESIKSKNTLNYDDWFKNIKKNIDKNKGKEFFKQMGIKWD